MSLQCSCLNWLYTEHKPLRFPLYRSLGSAVLTLTGNHSTFKLLKYKVNLVQETCYWEVMDEKICFSIHSAVHTVTAYKMFRRAELGYMILSFRSDILTFEL